MKIESIIISLLATGCTCIFDKATEVPDQPFEVKRTLDNRRVEFLMDGEHKPGHPDAEEVAKFLAEMDPRICEEECTDSDEVYDAGYGHWTGIEIESCTITPLPEATGDTGGADDTGSGADDTGTTPYWQLPGAELECNGIIPAHSIGCMGGRRPLAHRAPLVASDDRRGAQLAAMAHMETVSITAFEELADQLQAHGAPQDLVDRCRAAAEDERLHARLLGALAARHGGRFQGEAIPCQSGADLRTIAVHNAAEGCINEAWAACLATHQALTATDSMIRHAFKRIAKDEVRHAQLSWDMHAWFLTQLSPADQHLVHAAQADAIAALRGEKAQPEDALLGLPSAELDQDLRSRFADALAA